MNLSAMIWNLIPLFRGLVNFRLLLLTPHSFMKYSITQTLYIAALKNL